MKLNLGSGNRRLEGYVNVDRNERTSPDRVMDLEILPWHFADNSVDEIQASHVLEHLGQNPRDFCNIIKEIWRILKPGGEVFVRVPHPRSDAFLGDPTHVRAITPQLLSLFDREFCQKSIEKGWPNTPLAVYLEMNLQLRDTNYNLTPRWGEKLKNGEVSEQEMHYAIDTFSNVVDEIQMTLVKRE